VRAEEQLAGFLARYAPDIAERTEAVLERMRARLPGAVELVYDNYNALVIGFGPSERASDATLSVAVYPHWLRLCFLRGVELRDPGHLLEGDGKQVRTALLESADALGPLDDLIAQAVRQMPAWDADRPRRMVIKSVSAKQRARR
jgi:hypothetical protein